MDMEIDIDCYHTTPFDYQHVCDGIEKWFESHGIDADSLLMPDFNPEGKVVIRAGDIPDRYEDHFVRAVENICQDLSAWSLS